MAFFDVKVFNPFAKTHLNQNLEAVFRTNEKTKKRGYNAKVIRIEHGSFTPIVMSAFGGFGKETDRFVSKLIEKVAVKRDMVQSVAANYIRTKISFELVRSQVACIRGSRRIKKIELDSADMELVTNLASITDHE